MLRKVKVADEVWIATALLHHENPSRSDFTLSEIVERAEKEAVVEDLFITNDSRFSDLRVDGIQFIVPLDRSPL
jgi:uncharacterized protein (DUF1778 family)